MIVLIYLDIYMDIYTTTSTSSQTFWRDNIKIMVLFGKEKNEIK